MTRRIFSKLIKPAAVMGTVLSAGVLVSLPAMAQTESQTESSQEIELSPEAFEILCERSPLNSRCEGGATEARDSGTINRTETINQTDRIEQPTDPSDRVEQRTNPTETDPAEAVTDPDQAPVDRNSEGTSAPSTPSY